MATTEQSIKSEPVLTITSVPHENKPIINVETDTSIKTEDHENSDNQMNIDHDSSQVKIEENTISETWKVKGFPEYYKSGHVENIMISLNIDVIDVYKKTPNNTAFVRFKSVEAKLKAQPIINAYTGKKIKRLRCIEHPNRKEYENDLAKIKRRAMKRKLKPNKSDDKERKERKERNTKPQPTSIHEVVTPLYKTSYEDQLQIKRRHIDKAMKRFRRNLGNPKIMNPEYLRWLPKNKKYLCPVLGIISSPIIMEYRNKVSFSIGYNKITCKLTIGFQLGRFEHGAASIESCIDCVHIDFISKRIAICCSVFIQQQYDKYRYDCFNKHNHNGIWRKLDVRCSSRSKQFIVTLQIQNKELNDEEYAGLKKDFVDCICNEAQRIKHEFDYDLNGVTVLINNTVSTANNNECITEILYGSNCHYEYLCGLKFRVSATSFFQINTVSAERLYATAAQWALSMEYRKDERNTVLFDICCGTGTIGLCIAKQCGDRIKKLIGLELIEDAVKDAIFNAELNGFNNVEFIAGKAEGTLEKALDEEVGDDDYVVAILDPPRCGLHKDICKLLRMQRRIQRIVYVSCNPSSCINDAIRLCKTPSKKTVGTPFRPVKVIGVDLFPHTEHVEIIMQFQRCTEHDVDWSKLSRQASESHRKYLYAESQKKKKGCSEIPKDTCNKLIYDV